MIITSLRESKLIYDIKYFLKLFSLECFEREPDDFMILHEKIQLKSYIDLLIGGVTPARQNNEDEWFAERIQLSFSDDLLRRAQ